MNETKRVIEAGYRAAALAAADIGAADRLITVALAAKRLQTTPETIRRWIRAGKLSALRYPSGQFRISEALIENIRTTPYDTSRHL